MNEAPKMSNPKEWQKTLIETADQIRWVGWGPVFPQTEIEGQINFDIAQVLVHLGNAVSIDSYSLTHDILGFCINILQQTQATIEGHIDNDTQE